MERRYGRTPTQVNFWEIDNDFDISPGNPNDDCGVWVDWVFYIKTGSGDGDLQIWKDGVLVLDLQNVSIGNQPEEYRHKIGHMRQGGFQNGAVNQIVTYIEEIRLSTVNGGSYAEVAPIIRPNEPTFDSSCDTAQCIDAGETGVDASRNQTAEVDDTGYTETHTDGQNVFFHKWSDWQLCSSSNCDAEGDPIQSSYDDAVNSTTWVITSGNIDNNNTYYVRCRFASWAGDVDRDFDGTTAASDTDDIYDGEWAVMSFTTGGVSDTPDNNPQVLNPIGAKSVDAGQLLQFTVMATDPDGDTLTYSVSNLPTGTTFDLSTQTFSWIPSYVIASNYTVTFKVSEDGTPPLNDSETVSITVGDVDANPPAPNNLTLIK